MKHLKENNETYFSHLRFASSMALGFLYRSAFFITHGVFPCIDIPKDFNIDATSEWIDKAKKYTKDRVESKNGIKG